MNKLNFGCGTKYITKGYDNVDIIVDKRIHQSFDFDKFPYPLQKEKYDYVLLNQVIEHLLYPDRVLMELFKACKDRAIIEINTPFVNSKSAYCNLQHKSFFNERSFKLFAVDNPQFTLVSQRIKVQRYLRWLPKPIIRLLSTFLTNVCVELNVILRVNKNGR